MKKILRKYSKGLFSFNKYLDPEKPKIEVKGIVKVIEKLLERQYPTHNLYKEVFHKLTYQILVSPIVIKLL